MRPAFGPAGADAAAAAVLLLLLLLLPLLAGRNMIASAITKTNALSL
jgi:hypothetical protein